MPDRSRYLFGSSGLAYEASTYHFTTVPASKSAATPIFTTPNQPLKPTFDQIRVPHLGELWETFWVPRRPPGDPQGPPSELQGPQEALRKPQEASGNHRKPQETSGNHGKLSGSLGKLSGSLRQLSGSLRKPKPIYQPSIGSETPDSSPLATRMLIPTL